MAGQPNGDLLRLAEAEFDIFLTVDRKLQHQQKLADFNIAVVVLVARSNRLADLESALLRALERFTDAKPGRLIVVD